MEEYFEMVDSIFAEKLDKCHQSFKNAGQKLHRYFKIRYQIKHFETWCFLYFLIKYLFENSTASDFGFLDLIEILDFKSFPF